MGSIVDNGKRLAEKVIVVTGASSGIGKATSLLLAKHGAKVGLLDMNLPTATAEEIHKAGGEAAAFQCNVTSRPQVTTAIEGVVAKYGLLNGAYRSP
jgi:2-hydroxycyclohexanecarboxyl-CoA dehydrogenase